jgi:sterol desaturase/sphingolipid hydroxylase (fatty acid hydroxylase superfamily)
MNISPVVFAIPVYFLLMGLEWIALRFQKNPSYRMNDALTNINCGILSQITGVFLKVFSIGIYTLVYEKLRVVTLENNFFNLVILFILYDFLYYWAHRFSHEINLFWAGHVVHHSSEEYNLSVALRQSSTQTLWTFSFYLPLAVMGFDPLSLLLISGMNLLYQFWIHTESIGKLGVLEKILNTPSHHRVHHGKNPKYIDKNHGGTFIIFDKWFGTFEEEGEKPVYGITEPVKSWNPLWINFSHYHNIWSEIKTIPDLKNKILLLLNKPGWRPSEKENNTVDKDLIMTEKFDSHLEIKFKYYIIYQYVFLTAITAFFLFNANQFLAWEKTIITLLLIWSIFNQGGIFESYNSNVKSETIRLIVVGFFLFSFVNYNSWLFILGIIYILSSLLAWISITKQPT